jgi:hypothetical protein
MRSDTRLLHHGYTNLFLTELTEVENFQLHSLCIYVLTNSPKAKQEETKKTKQRCTHNKYNIIEGLLVQPQACFRSNSATVIKFLLGYITGQSGRLLPTFRRDISPPISALFAVCFMPILCFAYTSKLRMEATGSFGTLVDFHWTTRLVLLR